MRYQLLTFFLLFLLSCKTSEGDLDKIVSDIAQEEVYMSSAVGYAGVRPPQWERFEKLRELASDRDLVQLTKHTSPVVRCYSFEVLAEKDYPFTFDIVRNHLKDTSRVQTLIGCLGEETTVGDFYYQHSYKLSGDKKAVLDSIIVFDPEISLLVKSRILQNLEPKPEYYNRLREIYIDENNPYALIALSKYQNEQDIGFIQDWLNKTRTYDQYYGFRAAINFPIQEFKTRINEIHQQEIAKPTGFNYRLIRMLYLTLAKYGDVNSKEMILHTLENTSGSTLDYHSESIWVALNKYPNPVFEGLLDKVHISDYDKEELEYWIYEEDY